MAINQTRYVDITSGVGAAESVATRQLMGRLMTDNPLLPPQTFIQFNGSGAALAEDVGNYFGTGSQEYARALYYASWVSKNIKQAQGISFGRWVSIAQAAVIYGIQATYALATFTAVTSGSLNLTLGGFTHTLTGINLSAAGSLTAVASDIQTAIQAYSAGGADWTAATVTWDSSTSQFNFVGGVTGVEPLSVGVAGSGTDLAPLLGWTGVGVIVGQGSAVETITQTLNTTQGLSNNFGSFLFMPSSVSMTTANITSAATWNNLQNVFYQYMVPVTASNAAAVQAAIINYAGCDITLAPIADEYPEMIPMIILAATDYTGRASVQNYMFQIFPNTPSVTTDANANTYDALSINYYGQTQTAGQYIQFYQRGVCTGEANDPIDQNVYANEQWFKAALSAQILQLLLALAQLPANTTGQAQLLATIQSVIAQAILNGTISVGKTLDVTQQLYITNATGSNTAWQQVQTIGYWVNCVIVPIVTNGVTEYQAEYTLIYSKDDIIRFVQGTDVLI